MSCKCQSLEKIFDLEEGPKDFVNSLSEVDQGSWVTLFRCPICGQYWRVNEWDKYQTQFAIKLDSDSNWEDLDATQLEKGYLLKSRGGTTQDECIWAKCQNKQVKGVMYCVDHLYETGARK